MVKGEPKNLAIGLHKGYVVTKIKKHAKESRPSYRKGTLGKRVNFVREVVREVAGFAPYEKRIIEFLKTGQAKDQKKALKLAKKRLGTLIRGKRKRDELENILRLQRKKH